MNTVYVDLIWGFMIGMGVLLVLSFLAWLSPLFIAPIEAFVEICKCHHAAKKNKPC